MNCKTIIISAGGTGGHIIPALNVAKELIKRGVAVHYIGNKDSMEEDIITKNKIPFYPIEAQKLYREFTLKHALFPFKLTKSVSQSKKYFSQIKPDAFIGFGGFVSGPPAIASYLVKCPIYIQEQNTRPGVTNKYSAKFAKAIFAASEESKEYFPKEKVIVTGNPIDVEYFDKIHRLHSSSERKTLLILGGSQGSLFINNLILDHLDLFENLQMNIIWQTGKNHINIVSDKIKGRENITLFDFTDKLYEYYVQADYVICRGGALTLAEIELYRIPAFVIPLSTAAVNEQYYNAKSLESQNKCTVFNENELPYFAEKFRSFIASSFKMYSQHYETLHRTAITTIVNHIVGTPLMVSDENKIVGTPLMVSDENKNNQ